MKSSSPLLCVFAHPDDEAFGPSGTIALEAQQRDVYVLCVTDGNDPGRQDDTLSAIRRKELHQSATALGVKEVYFLDFADGTLANGIYHQVAARIQEYVEKLQPSTLLTYEPRGVSGHLDHVAVSHITSYVFERAPQVNEVWFFCISEAMRAEVKDYFIHFPAGYSLHEVDRVVDVSSVWPQILEATQAHQSQIGDVESVLRIRNKLPKEELLLVRTRQR